MRTRGGRCDLLTCWFGAGPHALIDLDDRRSIEILVCVMTECLHISRLESDFLEELSPIRSELSIAGNSDSQVEAETVRSKWLHALIKRFVMVLADCVNAARCITSVAATHFVQLSAKSEPEPMDMISLKKRSSICSELRGLD